MNIGQWTDLVLALACLANAVSWLTNTSRLKRLEDRLTRELILRSHH